MPECRRSGVAVGSAPESAEDDFTAPPQDIDLKEFKEQYAFPLLVDPEGDPVAPMTLSASRTTILDSDKEEIDPMSQLTRGSYVIRASMDEQIDSPVIITNKQKAAWVQDELKRIHFHKVSIVPTRTGSDMVITAEVIDNPIPLVPIIWGGAALTSTFLAGGFFVHKVESFTEGPSGLLLWATVGLGLAGLMWQN